MRARAGVGEVLLAPAPVLAELQHGAQMLVGHEDGGLDPRLLDAIDLHGIGHVGRVVHLHHVPSVHVHVVDDARRGRDELEIEFALKPLA